MRKKNKITGTDKKGFLLSKFTLSLPQRQLLFPVCCVCLQKQPIHKDFH